MINTEHIVIFGEVLFDCFDDGSRILGGAPFNVAWNLKALGVHPLFISKIGNDDMGRQILDAMNNWGMSTDGIQVDNNHPTGSVTVSIENDEPHFNIMQPVAYDFIEQNSLPYLPLTGILYHGSLALRHVESKLALSKVLTEMDAKIFIDINLRPPWWDMDLIHDISHSATWIKLNQHELDILTTGNSDQNRITQFFSAAEKVKELILTQAELGAMAITPEGQLNQIIPEPNPNFIDAVGAGDAFSSVMLLGKYHSWPTQLTMQRAQQFASAVVSLRGATTTEKAFYQDFSRQWKD